MGRRKFYDVFPGIKLKDNYKDVFNEVEVEKATVNKERTNYNIYIVTHRLIGRKIFDEVEETINEQFFPNVVVNVNIIENYELSSQYNLGIIFAEYKDSLAHIYAQGGQLDKAFFDRIKFEVVDDVIHASVADNLIAKDKAPKLESVIKSVFLTKFKIAVNMEWNFLSEKDENNDSELIYESLVKTINKNIVALRSKAESEKAAGEGESVASAASADSYKSGEDTKTKEVVSAPKEEVKKENKEDGKAKFNDGGRYKKRLPDDPSVIFGRNFADEDALPICEIQSEIGVVF